MNHKNIIVLLFLLGSVIPGYSQVFSVGVKAGVPLNDSPTITYPAVSNDTQRWLVGPTAEVHFPFRLSFEVDALYRQQKITWYDRYGPGPLYHQTFGDWQIPFLAKYELSGGLIRPFLDAGLSYRHVSGSYVYSANTAGFTIGGGATFKLLVLRVSPEFRYTRWFSDTDLYGFATTPTNQADFLVGFTF